MNESCDAQHVGTEERAIFELSCTLAAPDPRPRAKCRVAAGSCKNGEFKKMTDWMVWGFRVPKIDLGTSIDSGTEKSISRARDLIVPDIEFNSALEIDFSVPESVFCAR